MSNYMNGSAAPFSKMHGAGNDYIYFDCTGGRNSGIFADPEKYAVTLSHRRFGIGGDGIILLCDPEDPGAADFRMRMFNADGSEGRMCGNGIRCIAKFAFDSGLTAKETVNIETLSGIKRVKLLFGDSGDKSPCGAEVDMGAPDFSPASLPVVTGFDKIVGAEIVFAHGRREICTCVSMGNPHCVIFLGSGDIDEYPLEALGREAEASRALFPEGINTEIAQMLPDGSIKMRVWERGSGETWACGTGACAVFASAAADGKLGADSETVIRLRGGELSFRLDENGHIIMTGNAVTVFSGEVML